jgi:tetratricopeptide (TPR) repeat protein
VSEAVIRGTGLAATIAYAAIVGWLYVTQPQTVAQVTGGFTSAIGAYRIDQQAFEDGLRFFRAGQYTEARAAFARADAAGRDAPTQFYIAYAYYREGWGRIYNDDPLFAKGLAAVDKAIALAPDGRLIVNDPDLRMHSADELRAELQRGLTRDASDFNPMRLFRPRK